jgi:parallel beta-helix repeat protein
MAVIDREFVIDRRTHLPGRRSKKFVSLFLVIVIAMSLMVMTALLQLQKPDYTPSEPPTPARTAYTTHDPILIDGNAGFTNESGVVWGSGTESDPYIIEGWDINASTANGIEIWNTDAHFIVRGCHVYDGRGNYHCGIHPSNCANGTLDSNNCTNNNVGIELQSSSNNTLSKNTCSDNFRGIYISSSGNTLGSNTCSNNEYGIYLYESSGNTLGNNICSNNEYGLCLSSSSLNALSNNTCSSNNEHGISVWHSSNNNISNTTCSGNLRYGIYIDSESGFNMVWNNSFYNNNGATDTYDPAHIQVYDDGVGNIWNSSGSPHGFGSHWSDWTTPDSNMDGIVDNPYLLDGSAGAMDYYPRTTPAVIPEFSSPAIIVVITTVMVAVFAISRRSR